MTECSWTPWACPTTAGDFCRRFDADRIEALMDAINETRLAVWQRCPGLTEQTARIDGDGTLVPTTGACKEGMDISYNGIWGYHPLVGRPGRRLRQLPRKHERRLRPTAKCPRTP